jgi:dipeptidyl aminopeptidase/acylaminoacyl peptidase
MPFTRPRTSPHPLSRFLAAALVLAALAPALQAADRAGKKRPITETDLFRFVWVADPQISPDGRQVAFVRVTVAEDREGYDTAIWIVPADASEPPRPFTAGPRDGAPRWSPDGRQLAFLRSAEAKEGGPRPTYQLHVIPAAGGEARALTDLPRGAAAPAWSPDSRRLAFTSVSNEADLAKQARQKSKAKNAGGANPAPAAKADPKKPEKSPEKPDDDRESDVRVITEARYRADGQGFLDPKRPAHLWVVEVPRDPAAALPEARQLTRGEFAAGAPQWSNDGTRLLFTSTREKEAYYRAPDSDLWAVPAAGGDIAKAADIQGQITDFSQTPDGRAYALEAVPMTDPVRSYNQPDLFVTGSGAPRNLTADYDFDIGATLTGDQRAPRGEHPAPPVWSGDGRTLIIRSTEKGRANLVRIDAATGAVTPLTKGDHDVMSYTATEGGTAFALVISSPTRLGDLFHLDPATGKTARLSRFNDELFAELQLTEPQEIWYDSFDGRKIHAWVQLPPDHRPGQKHPLILNIHGGPHAAYGYTFVHEFQWMAAQGYAVLYPNPRGSTSYGQELGNIIQHRYPGDDAKDLLAGVDEMARRGLADPDRLGVTGGSGGGLLTNWIITQTNRFKAAASQRSIADWPGFWYTADFTLFQPSWFKAAPWEDPEDFAARSPITHVAKIRTPLMLIEGESDYRTPSAEGGEVLFRALKYLKRPVVMVRFPGESHDLSRTGQPWHRIERLQHIVAWFDKYLKGKETIAYDVPEVAP